MFVWELLEMLIHSLPEVVGNSNREFWMCWFTKTLSWAKAFLSDVRQSKVDFLHSWASSLREIQSQYKCGSVTLKWKRPHFQLTCPVQKRLCLSSLLGQWCVSLIPNNTKTIERMTCHCFVRPIRRDLKNSSYTTALYWTDTAEIRFVTSEHLVSGIWTCIKMKASKWRTSAVLV